MRSCRNSSIELPASIPASSPIDVNRNACLPVGRGFVTVTITEFGREYGERQDEVERERIDPVVEVIYV